MSAGSLRNVVFFGWGFCGSYSRRRYSGVEGFAARQVGWTKRFGDLGEIRDFWDFFYFNERIYLRFF